MYKRPNPWSADTQEGYRPTKNNPPDSFPNRLLFVARLLLDFQTASIVDTLTRALPEVKGKVLDVGCGQSPYRPYFTPGQVQYFGIDSVVADKFDYGKAGNPEITQFDGKHIPFGDGQFDFCLCTEVLEHIEEPRKFIDEIHRVLKPGGTGILTMPWAARLHYIPYDFQRLTPVALLKLFGGFSACEVAPRGTDIAVIGSKLLILYFRTIAPSKNFLLWPLQALFALAFAPAVALTSLICQLSLLFGIGCEDDPLGYTVTFRK